MTAHRKSPPSTLVPASILVAIVLAAAPSCSRADDTNTPPTDDGINSIPTLWLVDKQGNLREMNARDALEARVGKLLAE